MILDLKIIPQGRTRWSFDAIRDHIAAAHELDADEDDTTYERIWFGGEKYRSTGTGGGGGGTGGGGGGRGGGSKSRSPRHGKALAEFDTGELLSEIALRTRR